MALAGGPAGKTVTVQFTIGAAGGATAELNAKEGFSEVAMTSEGGAMGSSGGPPGGAEGERQAGPVTPQPDREEGVERDEDRREEDRRGGQ